ncbi:MAG: trimethylamine methyltransferase family protein [Dehalococcoidia bacterium]|nr:trimethylamine methyltransferase family protein [Dehalococcoidia bacterium]
MSKHLMRLLSDEDVGKIREESIKVLEEVGVKVSHEKAKKLLEEAGARVDHDTNLVLIPRSLIEECLKKLPRQILMAGRDPSRDVVLESDRQNVYNRSMTGAEGWIDLHTDKYRKVVLSDVKDFATIDDALENIHIATAPYYCDENLNLAARDVRLLQIMLENTSKHILMQPYGGKNTEYMVELGIAELGSAEALRKRPRFTVMTSPVPPLTYHGNEIDVMFCAGKYGIPLEITSMPICGAASPVTIVGGVLMTIAEHLAGVVISQVAHPGAPVIFAPRTCVLDMSTGSALEGTVENAMISAAETQVAKEGFGWFADMYGPTSDSLMHDGQSVIERTFNTILSRFAGADILAGGGNYEHSYTMDIVQLAVDNEIFGMAARAVKKLEVNDDTLGVAAMRRVGAGVDRNYLIDPHTMKYFKTEYSKHKLMVHSSRAIWESTGGKNLLERARERVKSILREYKPAPLPERIAQEQRAIAVRAEQEITEATTV